MSQDNVLNFRKFNHKRPMVYDIVIMTYHAMVIQDQAGHGSAEARTVGHRGSRDTPP